MGTQKSAGSGADQSALLPPFWRSLSNALPYGAETGAVRHVVYLGGSGITGHLIVSAVYVVVGAVIAAIGSHLIRRRRSRAA